MKEKYKLSREEEEIVKGLSKKTIDKIMTPKNDFIFKKLFGSVGREKLVKDFLEAILDLKIESVELGLETILLPEEIDDKTGVLDVRVKLEDGTNVDLEIQNAEQGFIIKRSHFYASRMYSSQIIAGTKYKDLKKVIVVFITNFIVFPKIENYHTKWLMTEQINLEEHFDELELHFIEMPKFLNTKFDKKRKIDQWLLFLDYSKKELLKEMMEENENIKEADEALEKMKKEKHMQYLAWLREKQVLDTNSHRDEGIEIGKSQGIAIEKVETVKRMLKNGRTIETIMEDTGLSRVEIEKIKMEME